MGRISTDRLNIDASEAAGSWNDHLRFRITGEGVDRCQSVVVPGNADGSFPFGNQTIIGNGRHEVASFVQLSEEIKTGLGIVERATIRKSRGVYRLDRLVRGARIARESY